MSGTSASNTHPQTEVCIRRPSETSVLNGYYQLLKMTFIEAFDRSFPIFTFPLHFLGTLWPCQRRHPHPCISRSVRNHSGVHYHYQSMMLYHRQNGATKNDRRSASVPYTAGSSAQYQNERNDACRGPSDTTIDTSSSDGASHKRIKT